MLCTVLSCSVVLYCEPGSPEIEGTNLHEEVQTALADLKLAPSLI